MVVQFNSWINSSNTQFSFNHSDLVAQEKSILGSYMGSCVPIRDVPRFLNLFKQGRLPVIN